MTVNNPVNARVCSKYGKEWSKIVLYLFITLLSTEQKYKSFFFITAWNKILRFLQRQIHRPEKIRFLENFAMLMWSQNLRNSTPFVFQIFTHYFKTFRHGNSRRFFDFLLFILAKIIYFSSQLFFYGSVFPN